MNGRDLPVPFGGPLRLRVPRQLGYKSVKYVTRLTLTNSLENFGKGLGSGIGGTESRVRLVRRHLTRARPCTRGVATQEAFHPASLKGPDM